MDIEYKDFCVRQGQKVDLKQYPTLAVPFYDSKEEYKGLLEKHVGELSRLQNIFYADGRYSMLLIFQAMDAAGKDSAIKHVMSGINPQGCQVFSFKHPSAEELMHDFLWRTTRDLPERGRIGIFNRSYYEEVLIVRVRPEILAAQLLPDELSRDKDIWRNRFRSISDLEKHLDQNGTKVLKFFLHLSKEEQRRRFLKRIDDPPKNWKFSISDVQERKLWRPYMDAYEACLSATSHEYAPWYVIPADDKLNAQLIISQIIIDTFKKHKIGTPKLDAKRRRELRLMRKKLQI
jgi:PPK2 family polyphosphate:nucleotide phosphotransferase